MNINHTRDLVRMASAYYDNTGVTEEQRKQDLNLVALCTWAFVRSMKRHLSPEDEDEADFQAELYEKHRYNDDIGVRQAIGTIARYIFFVLGLFVVIHASGIDLSGLALLGGALGVGIGFGLQNITNNFVSGVVILLERPVKVGDRIEVGGLQVMWCEFQPVLQLWLRMMV